MKAQIHPKYYPEAKVHCACGNTFTFGATVPELEVEICSQCHPFYTGQMKFVDAAGRVDAFSQKRANAKKNVLSKTERRKKKRAKKIRDMMNRPDTLDEIRKAITKSSKKKN
jgi:large subunit ribosomal protein L31